MKNKPKTPVEKEKIIEKVPFSLNEEQKNTRLFSINLKNGKGFSNKNATLEKFNFCLKNHCIGIGFTDFINSGLENPALEESKKTLLEMRKGDLVWIKHPQKDLHYIATIQSEAYPRFPIPVLKKMI
ncbi:MAG: hypothetical protein IKC69_01350 [Clostridia bacterium]|nr:hypothetical protein [Clostridia bacterium]